MRDKAKFIGLFFLLAVFCKAVPACADTFTEDQPMDFGKFVIKDNDAPYTITVGTNGVETYDPKFVAFYPGHQAIMHLTDFPPDTSLSITAADTALAPVAGLGPSFDIINFIFNPAFPVTDSSGALTLNVGVTLRTSGSGVRYYDDDYTGNWLISFNY